MNATMLIGVLATAVMPQTQVAQQQPTTDTTFEVRPGARIHIETFGGSITVNSWNKNQVRVQAVHSRRESVDVTSRSGSYIKIEAEGRMGPAVNVRMNVTVPTSAAIEMSGVNTDMSVTGVDGDVDAETVQGDITVTGGGRLKLESVEGEIMIDRAKGRVQANTVNRGIRITNVVGDIEAETVNGPIYVENAQATVVDLGTVNGRVVYSGTIREHGDYSLASHNGALWVTIPEKTGVSVDVSTFNGELDSTFPISVRDVSSKREFSFVLGSGSARLNLESFGGRIYLRRPGEQIPVYESPPRKNKGIKVKIHPNENDDE
jgi:DUF4097 and DUF4098 domain-containing protein YvlB